MPSGAVMSAQPGIGAVGTPLPQTTPDNSQGGPFIRYARVAQRPGYSTAGLAFGGVLTQPLSSAPGYLRGLEITIAATGGVNGTHTVTASADSPWNVIQWLQFKDPWGTPVVSIPGYELAQVINPYSGQCGVLTACNPQNYPSFTAVSIGASGTGNFQFRVYLPLEAVRGYCVMSVGNSSVLPTLFIQTAGAATFYGAVQPGTLPTLTVTVDESYYDVDPMNPVEPPGNGSSLQWNIGQANQQIGSASSVRAQLPHFGGYLTALNLVVRDSAGVRTDEAFNTAGRLRVYIDGIPQYDRTWYEWIDAVYAQIAGGFNLAGTTNGATPRPAGVLPIVFKDSLSQLNLGLLDSLETAVQTTPGSQFEVEMTPWGTSSSSTPPWTVNVVYGQIVPAGRIQQGLYEA